MRALRRHRAEKFIKKQLKIARCNGEDPKTPGKYRKRRAMDCGNPRCTLCGNPRRHGTRYVSGDEKITKQERVVLEKLKYELEEEYYGINEASAASI